MIVALGLVCQIGQSEIQVRLHAISGWHSMHAGCIGAVLILTHAHKYKQVSLSVWDSSNV